MLSIWRHGAVPYVSFLLMPTADVPGRSASGPERRYTLERIAAGDFDLQLTAWADACRALGVPLLLSFGADVNEDWGPWNGRWNGAGATEAYGDLDTPDGAERYRDAYRRLVTIFRSGGGEERQLRLLRRRALAVRRVGRRSPLLPGRRVCRLAGDLRLRLARPGRRGRPVRAQAHRLARLRDTDTVEPAADRGRCRHGRRRSTRQGRRAFSLDVFRALLVGSVRARESGGLVSRRGRDPGRCARACARVLPGRA